MLTLCSASLLAFHLALAIPGGSIEIIKHPPRGQPANAAPMGNTGAIPGQATGTPIAPAQPRSPAPQMPAGATQPGIPTPTTPAARTPQAPTSPPTAPSKLATAASGASASHRRPEHERAAELLEANRAYDSAAYSKAAVLYEQLVAEEPTGELLYNLGNSYLRLGQLGKAIAAYLRAERYMPRNQNLQANLAFARKSTKDAIPKAADAPVLHTLFFWHYDLSHGELWLALALANLVLWSLLGLRLVRRSSELLRWGAYAAGVVVVFLGTSAAIHSLWPRRDAVVQPSEVNVHAGIGSDTSVRFKLHEGSEMSVVDSQGGWLHIALPDGKQGWLRRSDVAVVEL